MLKHSKTLSGAALLLASILGISSGRASAQEAQGSQRPRQQGRPEPPDRSALAPELREETFRLMDAYVISNMQESLGLTDEQFVKVLPLVKRLHTERRDFARRRIEAIRAMRRALRSGTATEGSVSDLLKDVKTATAEERNAAIRNADALDAALSPLQQAKYRVFEAEVDARLRRLLEKPQARK